MVSHTFSQKCHENAEVTLGCFSPKDWAKLRFIGVAEAAIIVRVTLFCMALVHSSLHFIETKKTNLHGCFDKVLLILKTFIIEFTRSVDIAGVHKVSLFEELELVRVDGCSRFIPTSGFLVTLLKFFVALREVSFW